jgi:hypothetical protein
LQHLAGQMGPWAVSGYDWGWATEMRSWVTRHQSETYKCGLYCLDQLGRMTQPGQFVPKNITERDGSTNGFTAADLVNIGTGVGLRIHAAMLISTNNLPVPSILHLRSEHFVFLREQRGAFFNVIDPVAFGSRWLTLDDILEEVTGCVIVSDVVPPTGGASLTTLDQKSASVYRGRCHVPIPIDHDDSPSISPSPQTLCGGPGGPPAPPPPNPPIPTNSPNAIATPGRGKSCSACTGMADYFISEPWLNLWLQDTPITYTPAYGDSMSLRLAYTFRRQGSAVSGAYWHGAQFGNYSTVAEGVWCCSWLSFGELSTGDAEVDLMLPAGGWATFDFPSGSTLSTNSFLHNLVLEKQGPSGGITNLILHYQDGSSLAYGVYDKSDTSYNGIFYMTVSANAASNTTAFAYNTNQYLTTITAVDGTTFTFHYTNSLYPSYVTSVSTSYGQAVYIAYDQSTLLLTNITDAAGLSSQIVYENDSGYSFPASLITPYGATGCGVACAACGVVIPGPPPPPPKPRPPPIPPRTLPPPTYPPSK